MATIKTWVLETRPQFLPLSVVLAFLGTSIAWYDGYFHLGYAILAFVGLLLVHISEKSISKRLRLNNFYPSHTFS